MPKANARRSGCSGHRKQIAAARNGQDILARRKLSQKEHEARQGPRGYDALLAGPARISIRKEKAIRRCAAGIRRPSRRRDQANLDTEANRAWSRVSREPGEDGAQAVKSITVARNYAEALFAAGDNFGELLDGVAGALQADERIATVLESPRVSKAAKSQILERALTGEVPREFVRFLQAVVRRGRQGLLAEIAQEYQVLLDQKLNRVHAGVTLATEADPPQTQVVRRLAKALGLKCVHHFRSDPRILRGVVGR
jgi:F-type H+-transporting ATPase subunit delta